MAEEVAAEAPAQVVVASEGSKCCKHTVVYRLNCWFYRLGFAIAGFPRITICSCVVFAMLCGLGLRGFTWEKEVDKLWVPQGTLELRHKDMAMKYFPDLIKVENFVISPRSGGDLATRAAILQVVELMNMTASVRVEEDGANATFADLCFLGQRENASYCHTTSVLDLFYDTTYEAAPPRGFLEVVKAKVETLSDSDIRQVLLQPSLSSWLGGPLKRDDIMSVGTDSEGREMLRAFRVSILVNDDDHLIDWEHAWIDQFDVQDLPGIDVLTWNIQASCSYNDAFKSALGKDLPKMFMGYLLLTVYICVMIGRPHLVRMRISLGLKAVLGVLLAMIATAGVCSALGRFWGPVHSVLPLLLMGVGADDAFVIVNSFDRVSEVSPHPLRERLALALSKSGSAVTVTSLTNACAFFIGSMTVLPALSHFAVWAGIGVLLTYFFQITFFVACLTVDAQRQEQKRMDLLFCIRRDTSGGDGCVENGVLRRFFERKFGPFLLRNPVRICVLAFMVISLSICGYGITQLKINFSQSLFYIDGTSIKEYHDSERAFFPELNVFAYVHTGDLAYETAAVQKKMQNLCSESTGVVATSSEVKKGSTSCWYSQMRDAFNLTAPEVFNESSFYPKLQTFVAGPGARFENHLSFDGDGKLNATRFSLRFVHLNSNSEQVDAMRALQQAVDTADVDGAFPFARPFVWYAQFAVLKQEAFQSVGLALVVVFLVVLAMINTPSVCMVVFAGVAATAVDILGIVHYWDINLNSVTIIILAISVGLSVDFSAHIGLEFMEGIGSRSERMTEALGNLGPSLVHGGTSTFLVVSLLVLAKGYIFRVFFKMLFLTLGLGMFHGLVFVPVLLSIIGPGGFYGTAEQKRDANVRITTMIQRKK